MTLRISDALHAAATDPEVAVVQAITAPLRAGIDAARAAESSAG